MHRFIGRPASISSSRRLGAASERRCPSESQIGRTTSATHARYIKLTNVLLSNCPPVQPHVPHARSPAASLSLCCNWCQLLPAALLQISGIALLRERQPLFLKLRHLTSSRRRIERTFLCYINAISENIQLICSMNYRDYIFGNCTIHFWDEFYILHICICIIHFLHGFTFRDCAYVVHQFYPIHLLVLTAL